MNLDYHWNRSAIGVRVAVITYNGSHKPNTTNLDLTPHGHYSITNPRIVYEFLILDSIKVKF